MLRTANKLGVLLCVLGVLGTEVAPCASQSKVTKDHGQIAGLLEGFKSRDYRERQGSFYGLIEIGTPDGFRGRTWLLPSILQGLFQTYPEQENQIREALIKLLEREDSVVEASRAKFQGSGGAERLSEEYVNYWGDLIAAVAALKDPRALKGLLGAISTGGIAERGLIQLGPVALDGIIEKAERGDDITRMSATTVISRILDPGNKKAFGDSVSRVKIKTALVRAAADENPFVRRAAVEGLGKLQDPSVRPILQKLAREDPYEASKHGGPKGVYPVREAAKKALKLRN